MEEALAIVLVDHLQARLHVVDDEDHQAGVGDHQVERQADHPSTLCASSQARCRACGRRVKKSEDPPVHDGPADQRHQHQHPGDADVQADHAGVQVVVQGEEELAADRLRQRLAAHRVQLEGLELAAVARFPAGVPVRRPLARRQHPPGMGIGRALAQPVAHLVGAQRLRAGQVQVRLHPAGQLLVEAGQAAGEDDDEQQPADQQPRPGMQAGHRLTQVHGRAP